MASGLSHQGGMIPDDKTQFTTHHDLGYRASGLRES